jgi:hypothetical protein
MDNVEFLVWSSDLALGEDGNALIARFLQKTCMLVETEINEAGGIGGKNMILHYTRVPRGTEGIDRVLKTLRENPNIAFANGHIVLGPNQKLLDESDMDTHIIFSNSGGCVHPNDFNIARTSQATKVPAIAHILAGEKSDARVFFIHDGRRVADHAEEIAASHQGEFKPFNFWDFQEQPDIEKNLAPVLSDIGDDDVVILDVGLRVFRHIFDHLNESGKRPLVIKLFGSIEGRFPKIGFPLIEMTGDNTFPYLDFEDLARRSEIPMNDTEKAFLKDASWRLELPLLAAYAARQAGCIATEKAQFLTDMRSALNAIDGKRDIFIGKQLTYAFANNINQARTNYTFQFPPSLQTPGTYPKIYYPLQFFPGPDEATPITVNYLYIDILRVTHIDIGDGTWSAEFYLDIVSPHENPIDIVKFNNLSSINPKYEVKRMWEREDQEDGRSTSRYYVVANFDFTPEADNYPFDWQHIFVSYSITDHFRFGIIQPTPEALLDKEFHVNGWNLKDATSGILRRKSHIHEGATLETSLDVREESRVGWTLSRANSVTMLKIGIPLFFLLFLVYYTLFAPFGSENSSFGILTTAFLSAIALYFSTERPQPLRMTTIDLIFVWFYILTGITIIVTAAGLAISAEVYGILMSALKLLIPLGVVGVVIFLWRRIRSSPFKFNINR